ncbi:MAG: methylmalonyl-CoA decarboxylase [Chlorobi bacterium]|nr:methylmalonyl-CoA decarboxylase [Chlorobiota bacterium]
MQFIEQSIFEEIGFLTLNNETKSNSLNLQMLDEIVEAMVDFKKKGLRVVVVRSNPGAKVWCAGLRIDQLPEAGKDPVPFEYSLEKALKSLENFPGAVIAMIAGSVWGGGCELAFSCDILVGSPRTSFAITPAKIGAPYNPNQVNRVLQRVGSNIVMEMFFTADTIDAQRAGELGILNHIVDEGRLDGFTMDIARKIKANAPLAVSLIKSQVHQLACKTVDRLTNDPKSQKEIEKVYHSFDFKEGKRAFIEKRKPEFRGE